MIQKYLTTKSQKSKTKREKEIKNLTAEGTEYAEEERKRIKKEHSILFVIPNIPSALFAISAVSTEVIYERN
jgi:hypothetical protein